MPRARFLMTRPTYFAVEYAINPSMHMDNPVDQAKAIAQWENAVQKLRYAGAIVSVLPPQKGLPDMVFATDAGFVEKKEVLLATFRYKQREIERTRYKDWLKKKRFVVHELSLGYFEGGDFVRAGNSVVCGYGFRSTKNVAVVLRELFPHLHVLPALRLTDAFFFHLDTALALLDEKTVLYYPKAFDKKSVAIIKSSFPRSYIVKKQDALQFGLNLIVVDKTVFLHKASAELIKAIRSFGFKTVQLGLSEYLKAGGSIKCMTLRL